MPERLFLKKRFYSDSVFLYALSSNKKSLHYFAGWFSGMNESPSTQSPIARLILFIVCLAIAGSIVGGIHYVAVDLPQQNEAMLTVPQNNNCLAQTIACLKEPPGCCTGPCAGAC